MSDNSPITLKKDVLVRLIKAFFSENFSENVRLIPYEMRPKDAEVPFRCCRHKERAILRDRVIAGLGFSIENDDEGQSLSLYAKNALEREKPEEIPLTVLDEACKGCVPNRIFVTDLCQGCVARPCTKTCRFGAIQVINNRAQINPEKCKNCKMCISVCPYHAIMKIQVPCEDVCPVGAIEKDGNGRSKIDFEKCISCGRCMSACPFGAVHSKSQMIDVLKKITHQKKVIAMVAPSIVGQFNASLEQIKMALKKAGFSNVMEVAKGADETIRQEADEFVHRIEKEKQPFMTTSCCAGYNNLIEKHIPEIKPFVSDTKTPLFYTAEIVKKQNPDAVTVFISPCVAKQVEGFKNKKVDFVLTYQEIDALFDALSINVLDFKENELEKEISKQARRFGVSEGVSQAIVQRFKEDKKIVPCIINGLNKETIRQLKKIAKDQKTDGNLIEVMCCEGGCIGGCGTVVSQPKALKALKTVLEESQNIPQK